MNIVLHKDFIKAYKKLRSAQREKFKERRNLFLENPFHPILHNHSLQGRFYGYRSINVAGDLRVIYKMISEDTCLFVTIDTHSNLYQ
ncbi:hypothetical protein A3I40_02325 [Candidatus Uhrbacteria bacterium RIFCSPLOWO2_02_FULL_48_12]|uniref:Plasmid stabilization protein n=1 Tax=Candidatus Uhrbacteria bacterium RIFCSPLOWO2_02_FULL_48_12 TaxID=1802407 RepID=A0A1F7VAQ1_9BACT|nr:MAG: hypothetical protein A3I40_02325 [Candidatus Uhrbacteria bacterium RIFCSPLOWO2_02_FULL_48_12]